MKDWDFYQANINDQVASIYLDVSFFDKAPNPCRPKLAWYWIKMNNPRADGLSSDDDFDTLNAHEDDLVTYLSGSRTEYVGRITTQGRREFYFYMPEGTSVEDFFREFIGDEPKFLYQVGAKADPDWHHYFDVLYPGQNGLAQIKRRNT